MSRSRLMIVGLLLALCSSSAVAGPPFSTDSGRLIDQGSTEIDLYAEVSQSPGYTSATLPGVQLDYGLLSRVQVRLAAPLTFAGASNSNGRFGFGDIQFGTKFGVLTQTDQHPAVSVFPLLLVPVGSARRGLGQGRPSVALPIWVEQRFGTWKVYGGGGISFERLSSGRGRNAAFAGIATMRTITDRLSVGLEVFHREPTLIGAKASTNINVGGSYDINSLYHIYFSLGRGVQNLSSASRVSAYTSLALTF